MMNNNLFSLFVVVAALLVASTRALDEADESSALSFSPSSSGIASSSTLLNPSFGSTILPVTGAGGALTFSGKTATKTSAFQLGFDKPQILGGGGKTGIGFDLSKPNSKLVVPVAKEAAAPKLVVEKDETPGAPKQPAERQKINLVPAAGNATSPSGDEEAKKKEKENDAAAKKKLAPGVTPPPTGAAADKPVDIGYQSHDTARVHRSYNERWAHSDCKPHSTECSAKDDHCVFAYWFRPLAAPKNMWYPHARCTKRGTKRPLHDLCYENSECDSGICEMAHGEAGTSQQFSVKGVAGERWAKGQCV